MLGLIPPLYYSLLYPRTQGRAWHMAGAQWISTEGISGRVPISFRPQTPQCTHGRWWLAIFWLWHLKMPQTLRQQNVNTQWATGNSSSHSGGHYCPSASLTIIGLLWRKDTDFFNVSTRRELKDGQSTISSLDKWGMHPLTLSSTDQCHLPLRYIKSYRVVNWTYSTTYSQWIIELYSWNL